MNKTSDARTRCSWVTDNPLYLDYHDSEWGVPVRDDNKLFEFLILEGAQAGLSWLTILKRREAFRKAFDGFDPERMAYWNDAKIDALMEDRTIIRNRLKIQAARINARAFLEMNAGQNVFSAFLWNFVDGETIQNRWSAQGEVPAWTPLSKAISRELKKRGFTFVGPTICYAFMQAVGMVNDHTVDCFRHGEILALSS